MRMFILHVCVLRHQIHRKEVNQLTKIRTKHGKTVEGKFVRGYRPSIVDEGFRQVFGHYPTSKGKATVKDKNGKYHSGRRTW